MRGRVADATSKTPGGIANESPYPSPESWCYGKRFALEFLRGICTGGSHF